MSETTKVIEWQFTARDPRIEIIAEIGCWVWMRRTYKGYGQLSFRGRNNYRAHRAFWEEANGPIPSGLVLDHICRVRCCVNPDHLRAVTQWENVFANGSLAVTKQNASKVACPKCGSPYSLRAQTGTRYCQPCDTASKRTRRANPENRARETARERIRRHAARAATTLNKEA